MKVVKVILGVSVFLLVFWFLLYSYRTFENNINYKYVLEDVKYTQNTYDKSFNVTITHTRKEKNKEDIYVFDLQDLDGFFDVSTELAQSDYEEIIGFDNNIVSSQVYVLEFAVSAKYRKIYKSYSIVIYRYACLGGSDFTEEEIKEYANLTLDVFSNANSGESIYSGSYLLEKAPYTLMETYAVTEDVSSNFVNIPSEIN